MKGLKKTLLAVLDSDAFKVIGGVTLAYLYIKTALYVMEYFARWEQ
ncbi:MAG: hypothetical protein IJV12_00400 [Acidaminococcaceae bacterium]|nr:hypothetical protein [Acidaminococcaceae bacterium]